MSSKQTRPQRTFGHPPAMAVPSLVELCIRALAQDSQLSKLVAALRESELSGLHFPGTDLCQALRQAAQRGNVTAENWYIFMALGSWHCCSRAVSSSGMLP